MGGARIRFTCGLRVESIGPTVPYGLDIFSADGVQYVSALDDEQRPALLKITSAGVKSMCTFEDSRAGIEIRRYPLDGRVRDFQGGAP